MYDTMASPGICFIGVIFTIFLYFILKEKWKQDKDRDKKLLVIISIVIIIFSVLVFSISYILFPPETQYKGMKAILLYDNENQTTSEEIKEILNNNLSTVWEKDFGFKVFFPHMSNSSLAHLYKRDVKGIITINNKIDSSNNTEIKIELELYRSKGNPKEDKEEIIYDVEFIKNLFHEILGLPYSTEYEEINIESSF